MKYTIGILIFVLNGCWFWGQADYGDLSGTPSSKWSEKECLTIIVGAQNNNLLDNRSNLKVMALPYYPSVVKAIGRRSQSKYHWDENDFQIYVDGLLRQGCGFYIDWDHPGERVYDTHLRPVSSSTQMDSILFLMTLMNTGWPPADITQLSGNIYLINDEGKYIIPKYVTGQRMNSLGNNVERIFVLFELRAGGYHFLERSEKYYLAIKFSDQNIKLVYSANQAL